MNMKDHIDGTDIFINCSVEIFIDNINIWEIYSEYTYSKCNKSLYKLPFLFSFLIEEMERDRSLEQEIKGA